MEDITKPIRLSEHAKHQFSFRGTTEQQVIEAIQTEKGVVRLLPVSERA